jgi:two-component system, LuxR family, response regulator FixJ
LHVADTKQTVFVIDDDEQIRRYCAAVVEHEGLVTECFTSPGEFLQRYEQSLPGCLLLDMKMPGMSGLELQTVLISRGETIPIIFLTGSSDVPTAVEAMHLGAFDYLTKPVTAEPLLDRVRAALAFDAATRATVVRRQEMLELFEKLTDRERQVLALIVEGRSNKETAVRMNLSPRTVEIHRASLLRKTGARNTAHLVRIAMEMGIHRKPEPRPSL